MATRRNPSPVRPLTKQARAYNAALRKFYLNPLFARLRAGLAKAEAANQAWYAMDKVVRQYTALPRAGVPIDQVQKHLNALQGSHRQRVIKSFRSALGIDISTLLYDPVVTAYMDARISDNVDLIKTIPVRAHAGLKTRLEGLLQTAPFDESMLYRALRNEYQSSGYNLRRITRDQTSKITGQLNELRQRQLGIEGYQWLTSQDERVRETHRQNNGKWFLWSNPPVATGNPGNDIQCFPGSVRIAPLGLHRSITYRYVGQLVQIVLANGVQVTTTPNHPILTQTGWKRASFINESDQLLVHSSARHFATGALNPDLNKTHPRAEDLHSLLGGVRDLSRSSGRCVDLHGHHAGRDKEIEIVDAERELRNKLEFNFGQKLLNFGFVYPDMNVVSRRLPFLGFFDESFLLPTRVPGFVIRSRSETSSIFVRQSPESDSVGFGAAPYVEAQIFKARNDDGTADIELSRDFEDGYFGIPETLDFKMPNFSSFDVVQPILCTTFHFDGPVYSFETDSNLILANGVVTHNCRCVAIAAVTDADRRRLLAAVGKV